MLYSTNQAFGHIVKLKTTDPRHLTGVKERQLDDDVSTSFAEALKKSLSKVNDTQIKADELAQRMIHKPESVDIHTVMIAAQKAEISLLFTKTVRDEAIKAYRELINLR